jgi:hypothetical protein
MCATASNIFAFLADNADYMVDRQEIGCAAFLRLRRSMWSIISRLTEEEIAQYDLAEMLRHSLSEWLTVPIAFTELASPALATMSNTSSIAARWGSDMDFHFRTSSEALTELKQLISPMREQLGVMLRQAEARGERFGIYCHRSAVPHFASLAEEAGCRLPAAEAFIHSVVDYRDAAPYETLFKVGPLRTRGWGSVPSALLNAPRFRTLVQLVWEGCSDEPGFGTDLITAAVANFPPAVGDEISHSPPYIPDINRKTSFYGTRGWEHSHEDELGAEKVRDVAQERVTAVLVEISEQRGVFYKRAADPWIIDVDPKSVAPIRRQVLADIASKSLFLVWPRLEDSDFGRLRAGEGQYSARWKEVLREELAFHPEGLLRRLKAEGIPLLNLRASLELWCRNPTTVIHAPQRRQHFEILMRVLNLADGQGDESSGRGTSAWWRAAWREITKSRGVAVQSGLQEHEILDEELHGILRSRLPRILELARTEGREFRMEISSGESLEGSLLFYPIVAVEDALGVPTASLNVITPLDEARQWLG